jgi:hypothetical protein
LKPSEKNSQHTPFKSSDARSSLFAPIPFESSVIATLPAEHI